ncbi:MAG: helix-turn-helix transcriptional regulator [Deltaproteobacteria bacterium]|nr:helix-turn-helix transcriptional regulator [Deltaproteobacteria bacterium]
MVRKDMEDFGLTLREMQIIRLIADGASNRSIAETLGVTEGTVKNGINVLKPKITGVEAGGSFRLRLALWAHKVGPYQE